MKKLLWLGLALAVFAAAGPARAQDKTATHTITLYAPQPQTQPDLSRASFYLETGAYSGQYRFGDLGYGFFRSGADWDWFKIPSNVTDRGVIKDLGPHDWSETLTVPWLEPRAKLKPGEQRISGHAPRRVIDVSELPTEPERKSKGEPPVRTTPDLIRALVGHVYAVHLVDDRRDFYALVRIDALQRGDKCTISWKLIPSPPAN